MKITDGEIKDSIKTVKETDRARIKQLKKAQDEMRTRNIQILKIG